MVMLSIWSQIENAPKISKKVVPALKRLGIKTLRDLLFYFPARYEDFSNLKSIRDVKLNETVTIGGKIERVANRRTAKRHMFLTEAKVSDGTGKISVLWFNQPFLARALRAGSSVSLSGKVALGPKGIYLQNPAYEKLTSNQSPVTSIHTGGLIAIYPETRGISSRWLRYLIKTFIDLRKEVTDPLPEDTRRKYTLPEIKQALFSVHFPKNREEAEKSKHRFNFEKLLLIQLRALKERLHLKSQLAPVIPFKVSLMKEFVRSLPYDLTNAQRRSVWEIIQDIGKPRPMNRLLEGDVGSGKTVVAAAASLLAEKAGHQVAFMAPTEILARQHYETLQKVLKPFGVKIGLLVGAEKRVENNPDIFVGTHALIQESVKISNLGLVIVDEQHRFGVKQRAKLVTSNRLSVNREKMLPHFLSMSATPIPRTLALAIYGDLDLSILDEMPKERRPVVTKIIEPGKREEAYDFIRKEVKRGRQAFVICPRIEIGNQILEVGEKNRQRRFWLNEAKAVKKEYKKLSEEIFPDLKVGMLHGKMKSKEKEEVMKKFKNKESDILVSTSVVEVGIDNPNATIMMIEGAERFGLAQLHQFRGRVGRGADQSYCFLFSTEDGMVTKRLRAVVEAKNGFELAERDLEIRGPGEIFGARQWGVSDSLLVALADARIVREVRSEALDLVKKDPTLKIFPELKRLLEQMEKEVHLE